MDIWFIDTEEDGRISLTAPNGARLFTVSPEIAVMVGRMLIDEAGAGPDEEAEWD